MNSSYSINQANISITVTRWCNRRCSHCYIAPEELGNAEQMTSDVFRSSFKQAKKLLDFDHNLKEIEWEVIGGEATSMPIEFWYENLEWALDQVCSVNSQLPISGSLNFLSNLFYTDDRYLDLFNEFGQRDEFCIYTSWEPDTNRFGKNNKLFRKWSERLKSISAKNKILDVILTKEVIRLGPEYLAATFLPLGVTDFSIKMISPYGSGKEFWRPNMPSFKEIDCYLVELSTILPDGITFTPCDEIKSSIFRNTSYQCQGNFRYDLAIEPDGTTTFNASQTASESSVGYSSISILDPLWPIKTVLENSFELMRKQLLRYVACHKCAFYNRCNGGWYHYRTEPYDRLIEFGVEDNCPGYKSLWEQQSKTVPYEDRTIFSNTSAISSFLNNPVVCSVVLESEFECYQSLCSKISDGEGILLVLDSDQLFEKSYTERIIGYESFSNVAVKVCSRTFLSLERSEQIRVAETLIFLNAAIFPAHGLDLVVSWAIENISLLSGTMLGNIISSFTEGGIPIGLTADCVNEPYSVLDSYVNGIGSNMTSDLSGFISSMRV